MRAAVLLASLILTSGLASCFGTLGSRSCGADARERWLGWPLFDAVATDYRVVSEDPPQHHDAYFRLGHALSMPLDLVLDAVLLPLDVVAGVSGWRRRPVASEPDQPNAESH